MKTARRLLSVLLALLMVLSLVACGGGGETTDSGVGTDAQKPGPSTEDVGSSSGDNEVEVDVFTPPARPLSEMKDKTYKIIQHEDAVNPFGYSQDSKMGELVAQRVAEVQELYGCTLEFETIPYDSQFSQTIMARNLSGEGGDLIFSSNNAQLSKTIGTGGDQSAMVDLLLVDNIINFWDVEKWGNITARETMMAGGKFYAVTPNLWSGCTPSPFYTMLYNKDLVETFGIEDPQEYWEREEWDREVMLESITSCYDDSSGEAIFGISAGREHMVRATYFASGYQIISVDKINADNTAEYSVLIESDDTIEALTWLKNAWANYAKYFNDGDLNILSWNTYEEFLNGEAVYLLTRPKTFFSDIATSDEVPNFGVITWAGAEPNIQAGYYENCYSVAIPRFAQNYEQSAFLMYDLFEGVGEIQTFDDVLADYRENYFSTDIDVTCFLRPEGNFQYFYYARGNGKALENIMFELDTAASVEALVSKYANLDTEAIETHILPNKVALEKYRQAGYFK